jgi:NAD-dependent deacetylase
MTGTTSSPLDAAVQALEGARAVVVVTGAGMSQESGVPTFRDAQTGLWARFDPTELATEAAFRQHPARVFGWYLWRRHLIKKATPHPGYRALVRLEDLFDELLVVTQNVDGLHRSSGSGDVVELHGSLDAFRCLDRGHPFDVRVLDELGVLEPREVDPPACPACGSPIRPAVVWFGELLPAAAVERAWEAAASCDAMLVVGTSALVYPAAGLPWTTLERGGIVIEINPDRTPLSDRPVVSWRAGAGTALPALVDGLMRGRATT